MNEVKQGHVSGSFNFNALPLFTTVAYLGKLLTWVIHNVQDPGVGPILAGGQVVSYAQHIVISLFKGIFRLKFEIVVIFTLSCVIGDSSCFHLIEYFYCKKL